MDGVAAVAAAAVVVSCLFVAVNNLTNGKKLMSTFSSTISYVYVLFVTSTVCEWDETVVRYGGQTMTDDDKTGN